MKRKPTKPDPSDVWNLDRKQTKLVSKMAGQGIEALFRFCIPRNRINRGNHFRTFDAVSLQVAMRRFVSGAWLLHSEMLRGENDEVLTLEQLAKLPQLDCTKCTLSLEAKRFGEQFKFRARVQKREGSKPNYAAAAKTGWAKRRTRVEAEATA